MLLEPLHRDELALHHASSAAHGVHGRPLFLAHSRRGSEADEKDQRNHAHLDLDGSSANATYVILGTETHLRPNRFPQVVSTNTSASKE
jgi:hypothetical protein